MSGVALLTAASGPHEQLLELAKPTLQAYADRHGWDLIAGYCSGDRPASWYKIKLIRDFLMSSHDTVIWVDADAIVKDPSRSVLDVATPDRSLWMVMHRVPDGRQVPNCGVLVCHDDDRLLDFFDRVWEQTQYIQHPWWEQAAILDLLGWEVERPGGLANPPTVETEWSPLVGYLTTEWNSMPLHDPHPDPVIVHYSGMPFQTRVERMRADTGLVAA